MYMYSIISMCVYAYRSRRVWQQFTTVQLRAQTAVIETQAILQQCQPQAQTSVSASSLFCMIGQLKLKYQWLTDSIRFSEMRRWYMYVSHGALAACCRAEERSPKSSQEPEAQEDLKPFRDSPARALEEAMKQLTHKDEEWFTKCSGLNSLRRLALFHHEVMTSSALHTMHQIDLAVLEEIKNLRSQVSRLAIICMGEMLGSKLKKAIEPVSERGDAHPVQALAIEAQNAPHVQCTLALFLRREKSMTN